MKKLLIFLLILCSSAMVAESKTNFYESDLFAQMHEGDKAAILMVHFGTTHSDTRAKTINALNTAVRTAYPTLEIREAWTSRIIIRIMGKQGEVIPTPLEALQQLKKEGYTHVIIQSSNIIEGVEMESLRRDVAAMQREFKDVRVGNPLLYHTSDYECVADVIKAKQPSESAVVLVGHGTYTPSTAQYAMVEYVLNQKGYNDIHIGTIEGYPTYETMVKNLKKGATKKVTLMPFMFVAGEHAKNDIAGDWREMLTRDGFTVDVVMEGLGEQPEVIKLLIDHIKFATQNQMYNIMDKKVGYSRGKSF